MKLFELFATLSLDTQTFNQDVDTAIKKANGLGDAMEKGVTAKAVALGNAMYDAGKKAASVLLSLGQTAVVAAADIQAENAQFAATFRGMEDAAASAFDGIASDTNILAGRLRAVGMKEFAQFKGAGIDAAQSMEVMSRALQLSADGAAYYDISLEAADERIRSFLRGNVEAGDAIGLFTSALQRDNKAMELYNLEWKDLNEAQRQLTMLNIAEEIYAQSGALGQAAREGDAYANVIGNFQRAWKETLATLGGPILQRVTPAIERLTKWFQDNPETVQKLADVLGQIAGFTVDALIGGLEWISENGDVILATFNNLLNTINNIIAALSGSYQTDVTAQVTMDVSTNVTQATGSTTLGNIAGGVTQSSMTPDTPAAAAGQWLGNAIANLFGFGPKAVGMENVPYDGLAYLHKGEGVLTKAENQARLRGDNNTLQTIDYNQMADTLSVAMSGVQVIMDGKTVGHLVAGTVSRDIFTQSKSGRYGR